VNRGIQLLPNTKVILIVFVVSKVLTFC